jgi:SH3-like domain-containing protein
MAPDSKRLMECRPALTGRRSLCYAQLMKTDALVKTAVANIRSRPGQRAELFSQALIGHGVEIVEDRGKWLFCGLDDGSQGWIHQGSLSRDADALNMYSGVEGAIVRALVVRVQAEPMPGSETLAVATDGGRLAETGGEGEWSSVMLPDGRAGWLPKRVILRGDRLPTAEPKSIRALALAYLGIPYMWGGTSTLALDCSGLTQLVYRLHGLILPRNSNQQAESGMAVDISSGLNKLLAGDLLFFAEKERVDHVALSLGGTQIVHSSMSNGGVARESLEVGSKNFNARLNSILKSARRVIQAGRSQ